MHFTERILSHDGLLAANLATAAAVSIASVLVFTKIISWGSKFLGSKPSTNLPEPPRESGTENQPQEPEDTMASEATTSRPQRSSTLRAVIIPESSSPGFLEVPKKGAAPTGFAAEDQFDVYSAYMRSLSDELVSGMLLIRRGQPRS